MEYSAVPVHLPTMSTRGWDVPSRVHSSWGFRGGSSGGFTLAAPSASRVYGSAVPSGWMTAPLAVFRTFGSTSNARAAASTSMTRAAAPDFRILTKASWVDDWPPVSWVERAGLSSRVRSRSSNRSRRSVGRG